MDKRLLQIFCFSIFVTSCYSAETGVKHYDEQNRFDLTAVFRKTVEEYQNSLRLKLLKPLDNLQLRGIDEDFAFTPSGIQLQNSSKCYQDIKYIEQNIKSEWGLKMIDSYGKPESGILKGNFRWIGDYNECLGIRVSNPNSTTIGNFRGKYCSLTWSLKSFNLSQSFTFITGICIPDSCSVDELLPDALQLLHMAGAAPALNDSNSTMNSDVLKCKPTERYLNTGAKAMIALLSVFCLLTILGSSITIMKYLKGIIPASMYACYAGDKYNQFEGDSNSILGKDELQYDKELVQDAITDTTRVSLLDNLKTFLGCFCVFTNGAKMLDTSSSEGELLCIHGIRFWSMSWVILGHAYSVGFDQTRNLLEMVSLIDNFPFIAVLQGFFSVDSFFVLSGFLLMALSMKEFSKTKGKMPWLYFYIHRYLRLTPMYMIVLGFYATVNRYLGSGPYWPDGDYDEYCSKLWWKNLLYINNFNLDSGMCMGWSWYLANDMQFFIISPLFLITFWRRPKIGYSLLGIFLLVSCLCNFIITYQFDLSNGYITYLNEGLRDMDDINKKFIFYYKKIYSKPYTRIGPYLVGMLIGFIFFKRKASNAPKHNRIFLIVGWIAASSVTLATVYGLYHAHPGLIARSTYNALSRVCYAAGLSWVMYICLIGQGGFINRILSFKLYIPLSRLTYTAYLIHPLIMGGYMQSLKSSLEFSHPTMVALFLGFMLATYAISLPVALILESPIVALEKLIRKKFTTNKKAEAVN